MPKLKLEEHASRVVCPECKSARVMVRRVKVHVLERPVGTNRGQDNRRRRGTTDRLREESNA